MLLRLTYFSTATVPFSDGDLVDLLTRCREKNTVTAITGMMIYHRGHFAQALEGTERAVRETYARIEKDERHRDVHLELEENAQERAFPDWSMGFRDLSDGASAQVAGFSTFFRDVQGGVEVPAATSAHVMLRAFSRPETYRPERS